MDLDFSGAADDYFLNLNVQTTLALPTSRETVLHFCEAAQREFPQMTSFYQRETGEFVLEGDHEAGNYPWLELQTHRLSAGFFNPNSLEQAYHVHRWLLNRCPYFLGISPLDVECLDVLVGFNLDFQGNRDAIVADALLGGSPLAALLGDSDQRPLECEPNLVIALDAACTLQCRLSVETRSNSFQVRTGQYDPEPISVYFTIRKYPTPGQVMDTEKSFEQQRELCEDLARRIVLPNVIQPIAAAIASQ